MRVCVCLNALSFVIEICFELTGKKTESVKLPWQSVKKRPWRITAVLEKNIKKKEKSMKEVVDISAKDKISEKIRQSVESDEEARKCKHHDRARHAECRTNQNSKVLVKDSLRKHRMIDVKPQHLQQHMYTKEMNYGSDLLQRNLVPDSTDSVKKVKRCDSDTKLNQMYEEVKQYEDNLVEYHKRGNKEGLQHCSRMEQVDKLQLLERHQKASEYVGSKLNGNAKIEETGSSKGAMADSSGRRAGVDRHHYDRRKECSSDPARQHVRRALYRALSSR